MQRDSRRLFIERFPAGCVGVEGVHTPCYRVEASVERIIGALNMGKITMLDALEQANKEGEQLLGCKGMIKDPKPGCFAPDYKCGAFEPKTVFGEQS